MIISPSKSTRAAPISLGRGRAQRKDLARLEDMDFVPCEQFDRPPQLAEP